MSNLTIACAGLSLTLLVPAGGALAGSMQELPGIDDANEIAWDVNNDGVAVGTAYFGGFSATAVRWIDSELDVLDGPILGSESCDVYFSDSRTVTEAGTPVARVAAWCPDVDGGGEDIYRAATWSDAPRGWDPLPMPPSAPWTWSPVANGNGDVAYDVGDHFVLYDPASETLTDLPHIDPNDCVVWAHNNQGLLAGTCGDVPVAWKDGETIELGSKNSDDAYVRGLNDHGAMVGIISRFVFQQDMIHFPTRGAIWDLDAPEKPSIVRSGWTTDINNHGTIVGSLGYISDMRDFGEAAMWDGNGVERLGLLGGNRSIARAVNDNGVVVGESDTDNLLGTDVIHHHEIEYYERAAFIWTP